MEHKEMTKKMEAKIENINRKMNDEHVVQFFQKTVPAMLAIVKNSEHVASANGLLYLKHERDEDKVAGKKWLNRNEVFVAALEALMQDDLMPENLKHEFEDLF